MGQPINSKFIIILAIGVILISVSIVVIFTLPEYMPCSWHTPFSVNNSATQLVIDKCNFGEGLR